jgi:serine protease Do
MARWPRVEWVHHVGIGVALALMMGGCRERAVVPDAAPPTALSPSPSLPAVAPRLGYPGGSFVEIVAASRPAVVAILAKTPVKSGPAAMFPGAPDAVADVALGSGFLFDSKGPRILTTDRIATSASELRVVLVDGTEFPASVVGRDPLLDVALLAVERSSSQRLPLLPMGDSDVLAVGEWVLALGNPFGDEVTASAGLVSATGRDAAASMVQGPSRGFRTLLQTDARIHRGNSGGPVLNTAGQVIGIATATSERPTELSFVIPISRVLDIVDSLRENGRVTRAWLGAMVKPVTPELARLLSMAKATGAVITQLMAGSPAARSALRVGDVVLRWNEQDVDHRSLPWLVANTPAGRPVHVVVWRAGTAQELSVTTESMPQ